MGADEVNFSEGRSGSSVLGKDGLPPSGSKSGARVYRGSPGTWEVSFSPASDSGWVHRRPRTRPQGGEGCTGLRSETKPPAQVPRRKRKRGAWDGAGDVGGPHSVCLAAHVSGGFKSRSARGHGLISKGGGNASLAEGGGRYGDAYTGTQAKAGHSQGRPEATSTVLDTSEGRASTARWSLKGLRRTTGS